MISYYCPIPSNDNLQFIDWIEDIKHTNYLTAQVVNRKISFQYVGISAII